MPRAGLNPAAVVAAGAALADEIGFENLAMGLLAERLGVRTPSLYKHVESQDALVRGICVSATRELRDMLARATVGQAGPAAVHAYADAFRSWVRRHPGRYAASIRAPDADDEEGRAIANDHLEILYDVLAGFDLPDRRTVDAARGLRSALHGFVSLENVGGFGLTRDVDRSFRFIIDSLITGLQATPADDDGPHAEDGDDPGAPRREYHGSGR
jgi:AcrR family transcriptional regulator